MSPKPRRALWILMVALLVAGFGVVASSWIRPDDLGLDGDSLRACPQSPNCVCSQDGRASATVPPLSFEGDAARAMARLRRVLSALPGTTVVREDGRYLHAECATAWLRFVDDVEFLLDAEASVIHVRSASRVGYSDMGANRRRVEAIREGFAAAE